MRRGLVPTVAATLCAALIGASVTIGLNRCGKAEAREETKAETDARQDAWIEKHEVEIKPLVEMLKRHDGELRYIGSAVEWQTFIMSIMAERQGIDLKKYPGAPLKPMRKSVPTDAGGLIPTAAAAEDGPGKAVGR